jgi:hypothetical protein
MLILKDRKGEWKAIPALYATAYSNARGFSIRFEAFKISIPTMLPS